MDGRRRGRPLDRPGGRRPGLRGLGTGAHGRRRRSAPTSSRPGPSPPGRSTCGGSALLGDGAIGTVDGWAQLVGTHPAVGAARGRCCSPPCSSPWSRPVSAPRWRSPRRAPGLPLVPALVAAPRRPAHRSPANPPPSCCRRCLRGRSAVMWTALRGARLERTTRGLDAGTRERLLVGLVMVVVAGVASVGRVGAADPQRTVLRSYVDGYDASAVDTPLDDFRVYTKQRADFPGNVYAAAVAPGVRCPRGAAAALRGPRPVRRHLVARQRRRTPDRRELRGPIPARLGGHHVPAVGEPLAITVRVLDEWDLPWVPTAGNLTSFEFSFGRRRSGSSSCATTPPRRCGDDRPADPQRRLRLHRGPGRRLPGPLDGARSPTSTRTPPPGRASSRNRSPPGPATRAVRFRRSSASASGCARTAGTPTGQSPGRPATGRATASIGSARGSC